MIETGIEGKFDLIFVLIQLFLSFKYLLFGSYFIQKSKFFLVYSCPQYIFVSKGIFLILFKELKANENFKIGNTSFEVIFIPGHTSGHVAFYSKKEKIIFTGDTLFSLGCGRVFEGTNEQMFNSLNKFKKLPPDTKIYCGHEYTKKNLEFCIKYEPNNKYLKKKKDWINTKINSNLPSIPVSIEEELRTNIFLRCNEQEVKIALNLNNSSEQEIFTKLRDLKDNF